MAWGKQFLEYVLVGALLGAGFMAPGLWWTVFLGVGYYLWLLHQLRIGWLGSWFIWSIKYLLAIWWFWSVYPVDWLEVDPFLTLAAIAFCWIATGISLGCSGIFFWFIYRALSKQFSWLAIWSAPVLWVLAELVGAFVFSIVSYGPGATVGSQFSFGFIGYHLAHHGVLVHTAAIAGVYGLTLLVVALSCVGTILYRRHTTFAFLFGICVVSTGLLSVPVQRATTDPHKEITIAIVDTYFPKDQWRTTAGLTERKTSLQSAYTAAIKQEVDYIVFPEDNRLFDQSDLKLLQGLLTFLSSSSDPVVIDSSRIETSAGGVLQAVVFDPSTDELITLHKRYLVPEGEFLSTLYKLTLRGVGLGEVVDSLEQRVSFVVGDQTIQESVPAHLPGLLFCFESADPRGVRTIMHERTGEVPFVAHIVSHGWFNHPYTLWPQLESMVRVQAIWNRVPIVVAANYAEGYVVLSDGTVVHPAVVAHDEYWTIKEITIVTQ